MSNSTDPPDLAAWSLHCFCIGARSTPHHVIAADDNGRLLWHARHGTTRAQLRRLGIACHESQVLLLRAYGLLQVDHEVIRTSFAAFGSEEMATIRAQVFVRGAALAGEVADDAQRIVGTLAQSGHAAHAYALVFGHALDGATWNVLNARQALPVTTLSIERPFWNGAFWAVHPPRAHPAGTNEVTVGAQTLVTVWTDASLKGLDALATRWRSEQTLIVPTVRQTESDPLHAISAAIGERTAFAIDALAAELHASHRETCSLATLRLIVGHELIWETAERLVQLGAMTAPRALTIGDASRAELTALTYLRVDD